MQTNERNYTPLPDSLLPSDSPAVADDNGDTVSAGSPSVLATPPVPEIIETNEDEEKEIEEVKVKYKLTPKFNRWCELYTDPKNKRTYGNKTESAIQAYGLDPVKQRVVAGSMGYQNFKKLQNAASIFAEQKGYTFDKWLDVGWLKMLQSNSPDWWDRVGDLTGYRSMKPAVVVQNNTQNNQYNLNAPEVVDFNKKFREFITNE